MTVSTTEPSGSQRSYLTPDEPPTYSPPGLEDDGRAASPTTSPTRRKLWLATGALGTAIAGTIALALGMARTTDTLTAEQIYRQSADAVYRIDVYDDEGDICSFGTGFAVTDNGVIATNYHVIAGGQAATVTSADGHGSMVLGVIAYDIGTDLAILKTDASTENALPLSDETPPAGIHVVVLGNPEGLMNSVSQGIVSSIERDEGRGHDRIWFDAAISPGSSGGPIFDTEGRVVGVASGSIDGERDQNLNYAVSSVRLKELLDSADTSVWVNTIAGLTAAMLPMESDSDHEYWLNTRSGVRHNSSCRYFKNTQDGRLCEADGGRGCRVCGG